MILIHYGHKNVHHVPQNDGKWLEIDWGDCKSCFDSAESASDDHDNVDEYYQNIALKKFNVDASNNINLSFYLNDNIEQTVLLSQNDVSTSNEYDGGVSTREEDNNYYCIEYGLNHNVSLTWFCVCNVTFVIFFWDHFCLCVIIFVSLFMKSFFVQVCDFWCKLNDWL